MTEKQYAKMSDSEKKKEDWMNSKWRPMMGWMYMVTCITDFVIFPILWSLAQTLLKQPLTQWQPLTLQGAGLFHIAMGAVLGIAAYGRTQEKLGGANNGGIQPPATGGFGAPSGGFGGGMPAPRTVSPSPSFGAPAPSFGAQAPAAGGFNSSALGSNFQPAGSLPPLPPVSVQPTGNPTKTPAAVDDPDA